MGAGVSAARALRAPERQVWERRDTETQPAFEAFAVYRDMGQGRSLRAVERELGKSGSLISRWSGQHDWVARARAFDAEQDRVAWEAEMESVRRRKLDHLRKTRRLADMGHAAAGLGAREIMRRAQEGGRLPIGQARMLLEVGAEVARAAQHDELVLLGEASDQPAGIVSIEVTINALMERAREMAMESRRDAVELPASAVQEIS